MSELNLDAPAQELKLTGHPVITQTDAPTYDVHLPLSRALAPGEIDFIQRLGRPIQSPAGAVTIDSDAQHLVVLRTTLELVRDHLDSFKEILGQIAERGEEVRQEAVAAAQREAEKYAARDAEQKRRQELADDINLDD
ncbi:hypothetical protein A5647_21570 [Mycobacterium sp. 1100029.7]|nr:hypothetical protein A5647_21570 [Mycobacterium sp. 1100029.7]